MGPEYHLCIMEPLMKLCFMFGLCPFMKVAESKGKLKRGIKAFGFFMIALNTLAFFHEYLGKTKLHFEEYEVAVLVLEIGCSGTLSLSNALTSLRTIIIASDKSFILYNGLSEIESNIDFKPSKKSKRNFWKILSFYHLGIALVIILDISIVCRALGRDWTLYFVISSIQFYQYSLTILLITIILMNIKIRFKSLNIHLIKTTTALTSPQEPIISYKSQIDKSELAELKSIATSYNSLCKIIKAVNKLFGFTCLFAVLYTITKILHQLVLLLVYASTPRLFAGVDFGLDLIFLNLLWCICVLLQMLMVAGVSEGIRRDALRIPITCFELLTDVPANATDHLNKFIKNELMLIIQQSKSSYSIVHAAGFFPVNYSILGFILGSIGTYIVVVIQFIE